MGISGIFILISSACIESTEHSFDMDPTRSSLAQLMFPWYDKSFLPPSLPPTSNHLPRSNLVINIEIYDAERNVRKSKSYIVHGSVNLLVIWDKAVYGRKKKIYS